jgi:hypothetical protein
MIRVLVRSGRNNDEKNRARENRNRRGNLKEIINDAELTGYVNRTLAFTRP